MKYSHACSFPLKTSSAMHLCKFVTVHFFKIDAIVLFLFVSCERHYFETCRPLTNVTVASKVAESEAFLRRFVSLRPMEFQGHISQRSISFKIMTPARNDQKQNGKSIPGVRGGGGGGVRD